MNDVDNGMVCDSERTIDTTIEWHFGRVRGVHRSETTRLSVVICESLSKNGQFEEVFLSKPLGVCVFATY